MEKLRFVALYFLIFGLRSDAETGDSEFVKYPKAAIKVVVVDEENRPLPDCQVVGWFSHAPRYGETKVRTDKQSTNAKGTVTVSGITDGSYSVEIKRRGYYRSIVRPALTSISGETWLPSPAFATAIMKKVGSPVPMYAISGMPLTLPENGKPLAFDLEKRDWLPPHGLGVNGDLVFEQEKTEDSVSGATAKLRIGFSKPGDGIIPLFNLKGTESLLKLPRSAPSKGYETERVFSVAWREGQPYRDAPKPAQGYILRVRTVLDEKGNVKSAWYGKISGEIYWDPRNSKTALLKLSYYLNPDTTVKLEFDPKRNLFQDLPIRNSVSLP